MKGMLYLPQDLIRSCTAVQWRPAVEAMRTAFSCFDRGDCVMPHKQVVRWGDVQSENTLGRINALAAFVGGEVQAMGIKWIGSFPDNRAVGLPRATALIVLNSTVTGLPLCVMEGAYLSATRTMAVNLLAAEFLCRAGSRTLAIVGAGVQARFQLRGFLAAHPGIARVQVCNRTPARADRLVELCRRPGVELVIVATPEAAVSGADIVISATTSNEPVIRDFCLASGATYFHFSGHECVYPVFGAIDRIFADDWGTILDRGNLTPALMHRDGCLDESKLSGSLGGLVTGRTPGRLSDGETIAFCAMGLAIADIVLAHRVYQEALATGRGQEIPLWNNVDELFML